MNNQKRTWLNVFVTLLILLPGAPYVLLALALLLRPFDLQGILFVPGLLRHNAYYQLPSILFGKEVYPTEEFGFLPTTGGSVIAAVLYGIIALGLSVPISTVIRLLKTKGTEGQHATGN
jgi:hypothetical protein